MKINIPFLAVAAYNAIGFSTDDSPESLFPTFLTKFIHIVPLGKYSEIQTWRQ